MAYKHIRSANFPNVHVRMDARGVHGFSGRGGGAVNCQFGAGPWETFIQVNNPDGTVSFQSMAFPNVYLRMDGTGVVKFSERGGGTVNGQWTAGPYEKFLIVTNDDSTYSIQSNEFPNVFLRIDGAGVVGFSGPGAGTVNCQFGVGPYEKLIVCSPPTSDLVGAALDKFVGWFPQQADTINANRTTIMARCCPPYSTQPLPHVEKTPLGFSAFSSRAVSLSPCQSAMVSLAADIGVFALSIVGLRVNAGEIREALYVGLPGAELNALSRYLEALRIGYNAGGRVAARAIVDFLNGVFSVTSFGGIVWHYLYDEMSWWDWILSGVTALAQLLAWTTTEGMAAVAEIVLFITSLIQLPGDIQAACNACGSSQMSAFGINV